MSRIQTHTQDRRTAAELFRNVSDAMMAKYGNTAMLGTFAGPILPDEHPDEALMNFNRLVGDISPHLAVTGFNKSIPFCSDGKEVGAVDAGLVAEATAASVGTMVGDRSTELAKKIAVSFKFDLESGRRLDLTYAVTRERVCRHIGSQLQLTMTGTLFEQEVGAIDPLCTVDLWPVEEMRVLERIQQLGGIVLLPKPPV